MTASLMIAVYAVFASSPGDWLPLRTAALFSAAIASMLLFLLSEAPAL